MFSPQNAPKIGDFEILNHAEVPNAIIFVLCLVQHLTVPAQPLILAFSGTDWFMGGKLSPEARTDQPVTP